MPRLIWSRTALQDVARLHSFLEAKNADAARRAAAAIRQGVRLLAAHPEAGRPADDMPEGFRQWPISFGRSGYVVLYRYDKDVVLLAVRHGREQGFGGFDQG